MGLIVSNCVFNPCPVPLHRLTSFSLSHRRSLLPAWLDFFIFHRLPFFIHPRRPRLLSRARDCSSYASVMVPYAYYANIPGHEIKDIATNIHGCTSRATRCTRAKHIGNCNLCKQHRGRARDADVAFRSSGFFFLPRVVDRTASCRRSCGCFFLRR